MVSAATEKDGDLFDLDVPVPLFAHLAAVVIDGQVDLDGDPVDLHAVTFLASRYSSAVGKL
jgi:hypothetical protein